MANLCLNSRDAIGGVGSITIETGHATFDGAACARHPHSAPGDYVMLAVSDTGAGMDAETLSHTYEPFFTTKGRGGGTGLGLATVHGIVLQNGGFITVHSEPGKGTTFRIYLPRHAAPPEQAPRTPPSPPLSGGGTILLVEDEPAMLRMTTSTLERLGYRVLPAPTPREAIRFSAECGNGIDLLITDVVMPEMNGNTLVDVVSPLHPRMKVLFMSGYTADVLARNGVMGPGLNFLPKPFTRDELAAKLRDVLDPG